MYRLGIIIFLLLIGASGFTTNLWAQHVMPGIPFQVQARDRFNQAVKQQAIHVNSAIYFSQDTQLVYAEELLVNTDEQGVFQFTLGKGQFAGGLFTSLYKIPWEKMEYRVQIKIAIPPQPPIAGWNYQQNWVDLGSVPVGIVPYALYAVHTADSPPIKSKGRSVNLLAADSLVIRLENPLELDDGIAVTLEAERLPLSSPGYFIHRDMVRNQLIIFFTAPYTGYITWLIVD